MVINAVIAGCYHVTEYLGFVAFSKAIQAHDLHTRMDVCMKIIKNNKNFFDQSLDETKLLKYINKLIGLYFAVEEDVVEWLETSKVVSLMPTISLIFVVISVKSFIIFFVLS